VDGARLEAALEAALPAVSLTAAAKRFGKTLAAAVEAAAAAVEPVDFSDEADGRWEAELKLARREAELARSREDTETRALIAVAMNWDAGDAPPPLVSDSESDDSGDGDEARGGSGGAAQCRDASGDGGVGAVGVVQDGGDKGKTVGAAAPVAAGKKRGAGAAKKGKGKKKVATVTPPSKDGVMAIAVGTHDAAASGGGGGTAVSSPVSTPSAAGEAAPAADIGLKREQHVGVATPTPSSAVAVVPEASPETGVVVAEAGAKGGSDQSKGGGGNGSRATVGSGVDMEDYAVIRNWVHDVAAGRVMVRAGQLQRYFRGRVDKRGSGVSVW